MFQQLIPGESLIRPLPQKREEQVYRFPHVTIFMPFETRLHDKRKIENALTRAVDEASLEMTKRYPGDMRELVLQKLKNIVRNLNYNTFRKSIAIFISPVFEKVLYLDFEMEKRLVVGGHFQIRDIAHGKRRPQQFHVVVLGENEGRIFLDDAISSVFISADDLSDPKVEGNRRKDEFATFKSPQRKVSRSSELAGRINRSLNDILTIRRLPVFVMGNKKLLNRFCTIVQPNSAIAGWVEGKFRNLPLPQLRQRLQPYLQNWHFLQQQHLIHLLEIASKDNRLVTGFHQVHDSIMSYHGKTLLIGKRYLYAGDWQEEDNRTVSQKRIGKYSYLKDVMDEMMEKILEDGGDVELMSDDVLEDYNHIALITR